MPLAAVFRRPRRGRVRLAALGHRILGAPGHRALGCLALGALLVAGCESKPREHVRDFDSGSIVLDKVYRSMEGPVDEQLVRLGTEGEHEPVWITGVDVEPLDTAGADFADGQEFICHVNISHPSREAWMQEFQAKRASGRSLPFNWFTLVQGQYSLRFPDGFAVPASTDQGFRVFSMAQMQDPERKPFDMRIRSRLHYVYDRDLAQPMVPLSKFSWDVRVAAPYEAPKAASDVAVAPKAGSDVAEAPEAGSDTAEAPKAAHEPAAAGAAGGAHAGHDHSGASCAENDPNLAKPVPAPAAKPSGEAVLHFAVPPGRHEYRTKVDGASKIPFPTTAHHFSAHLHVYGESLELIDVTEGKTIFTSRATANDKHTGIAEMTSLATKDGVRIYPDHTYELVAVYDNPTDHPIDAMAVVYVYYRDEPPPAAQASL